MAFDLTALKQRARRVKIDLIALSLATRDPRTPWYAKLIIAGCVAYALSPVDVIPDFIPVLGLVDDILFIPVAIWLARSLVPAAVLGDCRARAEQVAAGARMRRITRLAAIALWLAVVLVLGILVYYAA